MDDRKKEVEIKDRLIKKVDMNLYEVINSICKIIYNNNVGTGFLIKLYKDEKKLNCLMTNEHIITKDMIESYKLINIFYKNEKKWIKIKLDKNKRYIKYDMDLDITIIEIIPEDEVKEKYFLLPNINNDVNYINEDIYIPQYPNGENLSYSEGKIKDINKYELIYDASTTSGSSGSPILLKNTTKVIGIHKQGSIKKSENYGTLIYSFIQLLQSSENNGDKKEKDKGNKLQENDLNNISEINNLYSDYPEKMLKIINKIREDPPSYADILEDCIKNIVKIKDPNDKSKTKIIYKDKVKVALYNGEIAFKNAAEKLRNMKALPPLKLKNEICVPLPEEAEGIKDSLYLKEQIKILNKKAHIDIFFQDLIKIPEVSALLMIVDDSEKNLGKRRQTLLNKDLKYIGISSKFIGKTFIAYFTFSK